MRTTDPETGYIGQTVIGQDCGPEVRCKRCNGRGMWRPAGAKELEKTILCLRCADDWLESGLLRKHGYVSSHKKWIAAFEEFCKTEPTQIDIDSHNRVIRQRDKMVHTMFPQFFSQVEG